MQRAFVSGIGEQRVCFLVSRGVAQRIGEEVRRILKAQGYQQADDPRLICIKADRRWVGTFTVSVLLPGMSGREPSKAEEAAVQRVRDALRAAVRPDKDIVQIWTGPGRLML